MIAGGGGGEVGALSCMFTCPVAANRSRFISDAAFDTWIGVRYFGCGFEHLVCDVFFFFIYILQPHAAQPAPHGLGCAKTHEQLHLQFFLFQQHVMTIPSQRVFFLNYYYYFEKKNPSSPPPLFALTICISKKSHRDLLCIFTSD